MTSPFDDPDAQYLVVVNAEAQYALWPTFADVPAGWTVALPAAGRVECLDYIERHWTDLRPASLVRAMTQD